MRIIVDFKQKEEKRKIGEVEQLSLFKADCLMFPQGWMRKENPTTMKLGQKNDVEGCFEFLLADWWDIILIFLIMNQLKSQTPTLIYFKTRGNAQVIRCVLLEIGIEFDEIFVAFNGYLEPQIVEKFNIDVKCLPYLIHKNHVITGLFPIIKYCCLQFNRPDLLGKSLQDSILVAEIMAKQIRRKGIILHTLFKGLKQVQEKHLGQEGIEQLKLKVVQIATDKQLVPLKNMFMKNRGFICGYLTILDFFYYDKTFYAANMSEKNTCPLRLQLQLIRLYKKFFQSTQFFKKNEERLAQYKVFFPEVDAAINEMIKQMWRGDPKYIY